MTAEGWIKLTRSPQGGDQVTSVLEDGMCGV